MVRFAAMCYGKILLVGVITFFVVTSYTYTLPNKFTLVELRNKQNDLQGHIKMNNNTGQTWALPLDIQGDGGAAVWVEIK